MIDDLRRTQIIRLLQTRDDNLPTPTRRDNTTAGFVHRSTSRESCPDCLANGRTMKTCETCHGMGWVENFRERDPYAIDKVQPYGLDRARHEATKERDRQIDRLTEQLAPPKSEQDLLEDANRHPYGWELARQRMYADYDYHHLDLALDQLREHDDGAAHCLHAVYVYGWMDSSSVMAGALERGLRFLDTRMPAVIRAPGDDTDTADAKTSLWRGKSERHAAAREERRARIVRAHVEWGFSAEEIALRESLTARRVRQILDGHRNAAGSDAAVATGPAA